MLSTHKRLDVQLAKTSNTMLNGVGEQTFSLLPLGIMPASDYSLSTLYQVDEVSIWSLLFLLGTHVGFC